MFPEQIQKRIDAGMGCGSGIGEGWLPLVIELDANIAKYVPNYVIDQVKEKFGGLRFYIGSVPEKVSVDIYKLISNAENESYKICDVCGKEGKRINVSGRGYIATRCELHKND